MSSMKDQLYGNSTCTKSSCQKEYLYTEDNTQRVGTSISGLYKHAQQQFNKWNRMHVHVTMSVCIYHHYQTGLLYAHYAITIMYRSM